MTRRKKIMLALLAFILCVAALVGIVVASEWTYLSRLRHFQQERPTPPEWFEPKEIVPGVKAPRPIAIASAPSIRANLLAQALEKAIAGNAAAFLILHEGAIVTEYYAPNHGPQKWTDSASMMKTITALLVGIAIHEKKILSIDESAAAYISEWSNDARKKITIRNLLQMHSGLEPEGEYEDPFSNACYLALGTDARHVVANAKLICEPGSRYDYNNANYQALGIVLEKASGQRFAALLSEKLWIPLGNSDAAVWLDKPAGLARTFGYLFATARDWARLGQMILDRGSVEGKQIVPAGWIEFMSTPSPTEPTYGAGFYTNVDDPEDPPFALKDTIALNGRGKQRVYVLPSKHIVIVRVGDRPKKWDDSFFPNLFAN